MADAEKISPSGLPIDAVYRPDGSFDYDRELGDPAKFPFTRGVQATMYRSRLWRMGE
jgi:methylmalonyl-CoA mutase N-terminal domain/subunit